VPPVKGGAVEQWVHHAAIAMAQKQLDITVFSRPSGVQEDSEIQYVGIPWTRMERACQWIKSRVSWRNPIRYFAKIQNVLSYGQRLAKQLSPFSMVIIHNEPNLLLMIPHQPAQTLILHMHNDHLTHAWFRWLYRMALKKVTMVICVSEYIRTNAIQYYPQHGHKFKVLFNATHAETFKPYGKVAQLNIREFAVFEPQANYILYVGRLTPEKGVDVLIEAFTQLLEKTPQARLMIVGSSFFEGAHKTAYQKKLIRLASPVKQAIQFTGFVSHDYLKYFYSCADLVVVPSVWQDPCPLVVLEAMASGTCLIATNVGGVPEVVRHRVNGFLVEANRPELLADTIQYALSHPEQSQQMGLEARKLILERHTWLQMMDRLTDLLFQERPMPTKS